MRSRASRFSSACLWFLLAPVGSGQVSGEGAPRLGRTLREACARPDDVPGPVGLIVSLRPGFTPSLDPIREARSEARGRPAGAPPGAARAVRDGAALARSGIEARMRAAGVRVLRHLWLVDGIAVEAPIGRAVEMAWWDEVSRVDLDEPRRPTLLESTEQIGADRAQVIRLGEAWLRGAGVRVAVADTGLDLNTGQIHPSVDLLDPESGGLHRPHKAYYLDGDPFTDSGGIEGSRVLRAVDLLTWDGTDTPEDINYRKGLNRGFGHGHSVTSIIAGARWTSLPTADDGVAPAAGICFYKVTNDTSLESDASSSSIITALEEAVADGARVFNLSFSGSQDPEDLLNRAIDQAGWDWNLLVTVPVGNCGPSGVGCAVPSGMVDHGSYNAVKAAAVSDLDDHVAGYSSRGPLPDGRRGVTIAAPSSAFDPGYTPANIYSALIDREEAVDTFGGTSASAPHVAGAAALLFQAAPELTALDAKALLMNTARDITDANPGLDGAAYGAGRLDVLEALRATRGDVFLARGREVPRGALRHEYDVTLRQGVSYRITLVWLRSLTEVFFLPLRNLDLDLLRGAQLLARSSSEVEPWEEIRFVPVETGTYTLEVHSGDSRTTTRYTLLLRALEEGVTPSRGLTSGGTLVQVPVSGIAVDENTRFRFGDVPAELVEILDPHTALVRTGPSAPETVDVIIEEGTDPHVHPWAFTYLEGRAAVRMGSVEVEPGGHADVLLTGDVNMDFQGVEVGLFYDPAYLAVDGLVFEGTVFEGRDPFETFRIDPQVFPGEALAHATVTLQGRDSLPGGKGLHLLGFRVQVAPHATDRILRLDLRNAASPDPVMNRVLAFGESFPAETQDGFVHVDTVPGAVYYLEVEEEPTGSLGDGFDVVLRADSDIAVASLSVGLVHGESVVLEEARAGETLLQANGGNPAEILEVDPVPESGVGLRAVVCEPDCGTIQPGVGLEVLRLHYRVLGPVGPVCECVETNLDFTTGPLGGLPGSEARTAAGAAIPLRTFGRIVVYSVRDVRFVRGDCDADGTLGLGDALHLLGVVFGVGLSPPCLAACDANGNDRVSLADVIYTLSRVFRGGPAPPSPFPACGYDPYRTIPCASFDRCQGAGGGL